MSGERQDTRRRTSRMTSSDEGKIEEALAALGQAATCLPIDIFSTSRMIADSGDVEYCRALIDRFGSHPNAFVRRCMLVAIRFIGGDFASSVAGYISKSLSDENGWVRYDAAWIIKDFGFSSESDLAVLLKMAGKLLKLSPERLEEVRVSSPDEYASKMAAEAIHAQQSS